MLILVSFYYVQSNFDTLEYALMKTFAMTLGELNYESDFIPDIKLHYPLASNVMFVFFSLAMPIILMNMLVCFDSLALQRGISPVFFTSETFQCL